VWYVPGTMSPLEFWWVVGAMFGICFSILAVGIFFRATRTIYRAIQREEASFSGPRWRYTCGMLISMLLFLPGWVSFLVVGLVAAMLPEHSTPDPITTAEIVTEGMILGGEFFFAAGQITIVVGWYAVRRAPVFVPPAARIVLSGDEGMKRRASR
jgi:hypothetical protein